MIDITKIDIGTLIELKRKPILILNHSNSELMESVDLNVGDKMMLLGVEEGIFLVKKNSLFREKPYTFYMIRVSVLFKTRIFWIVTNFTTNTNIKSLPNDLKQSFRETAMFELIE